MKFPSRKTTIALTAVLVAGIALPVFAGKMDPERRLERMTERLSLTPEQVEQIKPIMDQHFVEMDAFRKERQAEREKVRGQMKAMHDEHYAEIKTVLTPEQAATLDQMKDRHSERGYGKFGKHRGEACEHKRGGQYRD